MKVRFYRAVRCPGDWEFSVTAGPLQVRIGRSQFAVWWHRGNYSFATLVNRLYGYNRRAA